MKKAKFKRVLLIGFDGMDYNLFNRFRKQGHKFPDFEKLIAEGTFSPLWSTEPPISPVAWSTFTTGVNPGKHNIFDFLTTDRATYMPKMAGSDIIPPRRSLKIGPWEIPLGSPKIELKRKSQSFWKIVSSKGIYASVLRMPFTFPPEKFYGSMLVGPGHARPARHPGQLQFLFRRRRREFRHLRRRLRIAAAAGGRPFQRPHQGARPSVPQGQSAPGDPLHPGAGPRRKQRRDRRRQGKVHPGAEPAFPLGQAGFQGRADRRGRHRPMGAGRRRSR